MKKWLLIIMLVITAAFCGCGEKGTSPEPSGPNGDGSVSDDGGEDLGNEEESEGNPEEDYVYPGPY